MKAIKSVLLSVVVVLVFFLALKGYLGYHNYNKYKSLRAQAESIEKSYPELERHLRMAVRFSRNPLFFKELGRINLEMALVEIKFGTEEKRDFYLDQAQTSLLNLLKTNPADASGYYDMGRVYMLYNYPLLTYMDRGRVYFRKALELDPADEFLNLNILYIYLTQWDSLVDEERSFVFKRLGRMWQSNVNFIVRLRNRWMENYGDREILKRILAEDKDLWLQINKYFL